MNWHDEKITSTGLVSQMKNDDGYEIHFYTDKCEAYLAVQEVCRQFIDHKPLRNADRIRAMTDDELATWLYIHRWNDLESILEWLKQESGD